MTFFPSDFAFCYSVENKLYLVVVNRCVMVFTNRFVYKFDSRLLFGFVCSLILVVPLRIYILLYVVTDVSFD